MSFVPLTLSEIRSNQKSAAGGREVRIYADGVYDLFHFGHVQQLKQIKSAFPNARLIVGVITDEDVEKHKMKKPVMTHAERVQSVKLCGFVDEVIARPPFCLNIDFLDANQIDLTAHDDDPYPVREAGIADVFKPFKDADRFLATQRTPFISTTEIVSRIVSNPAQFVAR